jgi:hypothetical protein
MSEYVFAKFDINAARAAGVGTIHVPKGRAMPADDPFVRAHRNWFSPSPTVVSHSDPSRTSNQVEQMTAAPGESRRR